MIYFEDSGDRYLVNFSGDNFHELIDAAKNSGLLYDPEKKRWYGSNRNMYQFLSLSVNMGETVSPIVLEMFRPKQQTRRTRRQMRPELLKMPPLAPYQEEETKRALRTNRFYFAWEQGLGKTWGVVTVYNHLRDEGEIDKVLIICPPESVYNFRRNFIAMSTHPITVDDFYIVNTVNRKPFESDAHIVISTYRSFLMITDDAIKAQKKGRKFQKPILPIEEWGTNRMLILDEAHKVKNRQARQTHTITVHSSFFEYRYLLSGTPDPNGVEGYYSQLQILDPEIIPYTYYNWISEVANLGNGFSDYAINSYKPEKVEEFVTNIRPWVSRIFTEGNLDLPDRIVKKTYIGDFVGSKQEKIYRLLVEHVLLSLKKEDKKIIPHRVRQKFPYISLALDNPSLLKGKLLSNSPELEKLITTWKLKDHVKIEVCDSLVERAFEEGRKVIIWSGHPVTIEELAKHYKKHNPVFIHGQNELPKGVSKEEFRSNELDRFRKSPDRNLLIASFKVLSTAVDIVEATENIYFDRSWDLTDWLQSQKRTHRAGQTDRVMVYPLIIEGTLDERLDRRLDQKEDINNKLFESDSLSKDEWQSIFLGE